MRSSPLLLAVSFAAPSALLADLDVALPPGAPLEWRFELPFHLPEGHRGPIYTHTPARAEEKKEDDTPRGRTVVVQKKPEGTQPPPVPRFGSFNPMGAARILTMDIVGHIPWTSWTKTDAPPGELAYPPRLRADLWWLTVTALLRPSLHPAKVSRAETAQYLLLIGPPVREVAAGAGQGTIQPLVEYLKTNVPEIPDAPPDPLPLLRGVTNPEERMLVRWVAREIVADHPYSYNPLYARRTLSLGAEAIPALLAASGSAHALLRENAIGLLAAFSEPRLEVVKALHEALADPDAVARNRALEGLIRWGHKDTEKALIQSLKSNRDPYFTAYAVQALGRMGSVEARTPLLRLLKGDHRDKGDLWHTAVQALGRIPDPKGETRRALKTFQRFCAGRPEAFDQLPGMAPDAPDRPGDRARLLVDAATIAGARLGDDASKKRLLKILKEGSGAPQDGGGGVFRRQTVDPVLGAIEPSNQIQAIEALAALSEDDQLERIVRESRDFILRGYALDQVLRGGRRVDFVRKVAEDAALPSVLRVQAMEALALGEATREGAIAVAKSMVRGYLEKRDAAGPRRARRPDLDQDAIPSYECLAAIKLLGRHGALEAAALVDVVRRAREAGDYERLEGPEAPEDEERGRGRNVPAPGQVTRTTLKAFPALFETAVVELGRAATDPALAELLKVLQERGGPGRAEAALALGNFRRLAAADALLQALEDPEPWVRYAAYRSLRKLSGAEGFADWLFGSPAERAAAVKAWREWRAAKGQELPG